MPSDAVKEEVHILQAGLPLFKLLQLLGRDCRGPGPGLGSGRCLMGSQSCTVGTCEGEGEWARGGSAGPPPLTMANDGEPKQQSYRKMLGGWAGPNIPLRAPLLSGLDQILQTCKIDEKNKILFWQVFFMLKNGAFQFSILGFYLSSVICLPSRGAVCSTLALPPTPKG